jgi:hypothetical protein
MTWKSGGAGPPRKRRLARVVESFRHATLSPRAQPVALYFGFRDGLLRRAALTVRPPEWLQLTRSSTPNACPGLSMPRLAIAITVRRYFG